LDLESDEVSTIGGYVTSHLGHLPSSGEKTVLEDYNVIITAVDSRKILRLHFKRQPSAEAERSAALEAAD
jgi:Mg2+/Co2+ transporter CorC